MALKRWKILSSKRENTTGILGVRHDRVVSPRTGCEHDVYVIEFPAWVNVIPVTARKEVVLIKQYRHGVREITLEIPGGVIEHGDTPQEAAYRELVEETGYVARSIVPLGYVYPNPAIQNNRCYTYIAWDVVRDREPNLDEMEDIEVLVRPLSDIPRLIAQGDIMHALMVAAFCRFFFRYPELLGSGGNVWPKLRR